MNKNIRREIKEYIEKEIFEEYKLNEKGQKKFAICRNNRKY